MTIEVFNAVGGAAFFQALLHEWRLANEVVLSHEAVSEEDYRRARGRWSRLAVRWKMYGGHGWQAWREARRNRAQADVRVVTTNPFFAPALVARAGGAQVPTVNLLYDLYPEALIHAGSTSVGSWTARRCAAITRYALRECAATVFLGEHLRRHAEHAHGRARRAVVIPVGADGTPFRQRPPQPLPPDAPVRVLYCGQLGRMHDVATLIAAWQGEPAMFREVRWLFHASGTGYARLRKETGTPPGVSWGEALDDAPWREAMTSAHVALVTMAPGAERIVMPSKTYSALVAGQAILAVCPRDSDLADLVRRHDCGWVVEPGDVAGLRAVVSRWREMPAELHAKRAAAFAAGHRCYDMRPVGAQWLDLLRELQTARVSAPATSARSRHEAFV